MLREVSNNKLNTNQLAGSEVNRWMTQTWIDALQGWERRNEYTPRSVENALNRRSIWLGTPT